MGTVFKEAIVQKFKARLRGELIRPTDPGYDAARKVWNGMIDKHPFLIARCAGVADAIAAVHFARDHDLLVAVRGGGHSVAGNSMCDGGMVIDLSRMKGIRVDPARRTARAEPGLTLGEFDHETQAFGLATTAGMVSTTGIAGLTLGGGIGWLMRKHGITCDNLLSVDIVTAEGKLLKASHDENPDLFWGIRGGGGNFGIVTSFEYRLHPVGPALAGMVVHPLAKAGDVLRFYREYAATVPDELTCLVSLRIAPALPFLPPDIHGSPVISLVVCYAGPIEKGERVVRPLREFGPPLVDLISPTPYAAHQSVFDAGLPAGLQVYWKSGHLAALSDDAINAIIAHVTNISSPQSNVFIFQLGGAVSRVSEDDMAYSHRDAAYALEITSNWVDPNESDEHIHWTREFWMALEPHSTGAVYVNFLGSEGEDRVTAAYGAKKYAKLVALKNKYDPTNFFRLNQNIKPAPG